MEELIANGGKKMKKKETKWRKATREGKIDSSSSDQHTPLEWPVFDPEPDSDIILNNQTLNDSKGGLLSKMTLTHR